MRQAVIDASVVLAVTMRETYPTWVDEALTEAADGRLDLLAPTLLWVEVGNRLVRRDVSDERALECLLRLDALGIEAVQLGRPLRLRALQSARELGLTMYDAAYLVVAESTSSPMLTLDRRLERAASALGLGRIGNGGRISEAKATYGQHEIDTTSVAAIGAAIAEMREAYAQD